MNAVFVLSHVQVSSISTLMNKLFNNVRVAHPLPSMFQAAKVDRKLVSALVSDKRVQYLLFAGTKASKVCKQIKEFSERVRTLPKPTVLNSTMTLMLDAVQKDLDEFSSNTHQKVMAKENEKFRLANFSWFQGSTTLAQVLTRTLNPGETRVGLASRCVALLKSQGMGCEPALLKSAQALSEGK